MSAIMSQAWKIVKTHIPLIKFRKGGTESAVAAAVSGSGNAPSGSGKPSSAQPGPLIEDWQLPPRYRRSALDEKEIDAINSGGAY